jgi:hypothetical protein
MIRRGGEPVTAARLRAALLRRLSRLGGRFAPLPPPPDIPPAWPPAASLPRPAREVARVVFCKPRGSAWHGIGKMTPPFFLPPFCTELARHGVGTVFVTDAAGLRAAVTRNCAVIFVFNEEQHDPARVAALEQLLQPDVAAACAGALVFCAPGQGRLLGDKRATAAHLAAHGVPVPPELTRADETVFSRALSGSSQPYAILPPGSPLDPARYNTRLIDTRFTHDGREWFGALRLMCVGRRVIHVSARARDAAEGNASVHATDMPNDPALIGAATDAMVTGSEAGLEALAARLADALGPGFFHHDIIRERGSGRYFVCEVGYKFNHMGSVPTLFAALPAEVTGTDHGYIATEEWGRRSAQAFMDEARRLGLRIPAAPREAVAP